MSVVNCFWIYIFDKIPTGTGLSRWLASTLWIAFEFISLTRFQQAILYVFALDKVVNCFWIYIFDKIPTGTSSPFSFLPALWIAFEFISLTRFQQGVLATTKSRLGCELLLNLYLWQDSNRKRVRDTNIHPVVNCFWIYIFDKIPTGNMIIWMILQMLWIAFEFISLTRFQQVTIHIKRLSNSCELLLNLYLWQDSNRTCIILSGFLQVVNCFWIYIFDKIPTG